MNAARRSRQRANWPRGLYTPRENYYIWRRPDGKVYPIGRVPLATAIAEARDANQLLESRRLTLADRLSGAGQTVSELLRKMPKASKPNTAKSERSLDAKISAAMGAAQVSAITVRDVAELLEGIIAAGHQRTAQALRSRLIRVFARGVSLGWIDHNPAAVTEAPKVRVKRARLTLETFRAIYAQAADVAEWLPMAMRLAMVTGADRSTVASLQRSMVSDGFLTYQRSKTGARIAVPLHLRLDALGWTLGDVVAERTGVLSPWLVHHVKPWNKAPAGSPVKLDLFSKAFAKARDRAGLEGVSFHELRSLSRRLYGEQGGIDIKTLFGWRDEKMADKYGDPRGSEPVRVRVG